MRLARPVFTGIFFILVPVLGLVFFRSAPSRDVAASAIAGHPDFKARRLAVVPRSVYVNPGYLDGSMAESGPYTATEFGFAAPTVAALAALKLVEVTEYIGPADLANPPEAQERMSDSERAEARRSPAYAHTFMVRPLEPLTRVAGFADAEGERERQEAGDIAVTMTPGWQFPIADRELVSVVKVERNPKNFRRYGAAFCWRWRTLPAGEPFAVGGDTFDRIPELLWKDASPLENRRGQDTFFDTELHGGVGFLNNESGHWAIGLLVWAEGLEPTEKECHGELTRDQGLDALARVIWKSGPTR